MTERDDVTDPSSTPPFRARPVGTSRRPVLRSARRPQPSPPCSPRPRRPGAGSDRARARRPPRRPDARRTPGSRRLARTRAAGIHAAEVALARPRRGSRAPWTSPVLTTDPFALLGLSWPAHAPDPRPSRSAGAPGRRRSGGSSGARCRCSTTAPTPTTRRPCATRASRCGSAAPTACSVRVSGHRPARGAALAHPPPALRRRPASTLLLPAHRGSTRRPAAAAPAARHRGPPRHPAPPRLERRRVVARGRAVATTTRSSRCTCTTRSAATTTPRRDRRPDQGHVLLPHNTLGWSDLGYNFLVDRFGRIWEGRAGGIDLRGARRAHLGFNATSCGVSVIGNFEQVAARATPTSPRSPGSRRGSSALYGRDPLGTTDGASEGSDKFRRGRTVTLPVIDGHRDTNDTACPGRHLYARLDDIRTARPAVLAAAAVPTRRRHHAVRRRRRPDARARRSSSGRGRSRPGRRRAPSTPGCATACRSARPAQAKRRGDRRRRRPRAVGRRHPQRSGSAARRPAHRPARAGPLRPRVDSPSARSTSPRRGAGRGGGHRQHAGRRPPTAPPAPPRWPAPRAAWSSPSTAAPRPCRWSPACHRHVPASRRCAHRAGRLQRHRPGAPGDGVDTAVPDPRHVAHSGRPAPTRRLRADHTLSALHSLPSGVQTARRDQECNGPSRPSPPTGSPCAPSASPTSAVSTASPWTTSPPRPRSRAAPCSTTSPARSTPCSGSFPSLDDDAVDGLLRRRARPTTSCTTCAPWCCRCSAHRAARARGPRPRAPHHARATRASSRAAHECYDRRSAPRSSSTRHPRGPRLRARRAPGWPSRVLAALFDAALEEFLDDPDERPFAAPLRREPAHRPLPARRLTAARPARHHPTAPRTTDPGDPHGHPALPPRQDRLPALAALPRRLARRCSSSSAASPRRFSKPFTDAFTIPGIPSEKAADLQAELFPASQDAFAQANVNVVVAAPEGEQPRRSRATSRPSTTLVDDLEDLPQVSTAPEANPQLGNPVDLAQHADRGDRCEAAQTRPAPTPTAARRTPRPSRPLSADGRAGIIAFDLDVDSPTDVEPGHDRRPRRRDGAPPATPASRSRPTARARRRQSFGGGAAEAIGIAIALVDPAADLRLPGRRRHCPSSPPSSGSASASPASPP